MNSPATGALIINRVYILQKLLNIWKTGKEDKLSVLSLIILFYEKLERQYGKYNINLWFEDKERYIIYDILDKAESYSNVFLELDWDHEKFRKIIASIKIA